MQGKTWGIITPDRVRVMSNFTRSFWFLVFLRDRGSRGTERVEAFCLFLFLFTGYRYCALPHSSGTNLCSKLYYSDLKQITENNDGKENIKLAQER